MGYFDHEDAAKILKDKYNFTFNNIKKSWDVLHMLQTIMHFAPNNKEKAYIANLGAGCDSSLNLLLQNGYTHLYACDLGGKQCIDGKESRTLAIDNSMQDMQATTWETAKFDILMSISVIEHGVDYLRFLREANRLLKVGGLVTISFDYFIDAFNGTENWYTTMKRRPKAYGLPWLPWNNEMVATRLSPEVLSRYGFELVKKDCTFDYYHNWGLRPVHWLGAHYTFGMFTLKKTASLERIWFPHILVEGQLSHETELERLREQHPRAQIFAASTRA